MLKLIKFYLCLLVLPLNVVFSGEVCKLGNCSDGSRAYVQPYSEQRAFIDGYEGRCGQTTAANLFKMHCNKDLYSPNLLNGYFNDITPGVRPATLADGLNKIFDRNHISCPFSGRWSVYEATDEADFLDLINKGLGQINYGGRKWQSFKRKRIQVMAERSPLAVLVIPSWGEKGKSLHWITIVDMYFLKNTCYMIYNDDGYQFKTTCKRVANMASKTLLGPISPYTVIKFD